MQGLVGSVHSEGQSLLRGGHIGRGGEVTGTAAGKGSVTVKCPGEGVVTPVESRLGGDGLFGEITRLAAMAEVQMAEGGHAQDGSAVGRERQFLKEFAEGEVVPPVLIKEVAAVIGDAHGLEFHVFEDVVVGAALVGVEGVVAGGGEPFAGGGFDGGGGGGEVFGGEGLGDAFLDGLLEFFFDGEFDDAFEVGAGEGFGAFGEEVVVDDPRGACL